MHLQQVRGVGLMVVSERFYKVKDFAPAEGNLLYEIWQSAQEQAPELNLKTHFYDGDDIEARSKLFQEVRTICPSFILFNTDGDIEELDSVLEELHEFWNGTTLLLTFDAIYDWHQVRLRWLLAKCAKPVLLAIDCQPRWLQGKLQILAPIPIPISDQSKSLIENKIARLDELAEITEKISFAGRVFGERGAKLSTIQAFPIKQSRFPLALSQSNFSYPEYIALLSRSFATLNFAEANLARGSHLKTRVLETCLFGGVLITDGVEFASQYLSPQAFIGWETYDELLSKLQDLDNNPREIDDIRKRAVVDGKEMNLVFWKTISEAIQ